MRTDGILTFTAKAKNGIYSEVREVLERKLGDDEDLLFLDYASVKKHTFRKSAFIALTSHRLLLFSFDIFSLEEIASISWWEMQSIRLLPLTKFSFLYPGSRLAELVYEDAGESKKILFGVGRPGTPDKTQALVRNLSLRFTSGDVSIYTAADTLIFHEKGQVRSVRLRRWIFDATLDSENHAIVVLLTNEAVLHQRLHNLLYVDFSGEVRWRGALPTSKGVPDSFLKIEVTAGDVIGHTWSGFICRLERERGQIARLQRASDPDNSRGDLETLSEDGKKATLILAGEDRLGNRLYRLFIESSHLFKERLFGGQAHWSPDGRYLAVQEYYLSRLHGIQSVGVVVFDLQENKEALVEKSVSRNFAPQGWKSSETLIYGQGLGRDLNIDEISVRRVFWLPLKNVGLEVNR